MKRILVLLLGSFGLVAMAPQNGAAPVRQWPTITVKTAHCGQFSFKPALLERLQSDFLKRVAFEGSQFAEFATGQPVVELPTETGIDRATAELIIKVAHADDATRVKMLWDLPVETCSRLSCAFDFLESVQLYQEATVYYLVKFFAQATAQEVAECGQDIERMVHRICAEPFHLTGDGACLLYCVLKKHDFDPVLTSKLEEYTAHNLLDNAQFFIQSSALGGLRNEAELLESVQRFANELQPEYPTLPDQQILRLAYERAIAKREKELCGLPDSAASVFLMHSELTREKLLPARVLRPELTRITTVKAQFVAADKNGAYVCVRHGNSSFLQVYDMQSMRRVGGVIGDRAKFSPDGQWFLASDEDYLDDFSETSLYKTKDMAQVGESWGCDDAKFSPNSKWVLWRNNGIIGLITTSYAARAGMSVYGEHAEFSPDSERVLISARGSMSLHKTPNMEQIGVSVHESLYHAFSADSRFLLLYGDGTIRLYRTRDMVQLGTTEPGQGAVFSPDSQWLAISDARTTRFYKTQNMEQVGNAVPGHVADFSTDSQWVGCSYEDTLYKIQGMEKVDRARLPEGVEFALRDPTLVRTTGELLLRRGIGSMLLCARSSGCQLAQIPGSGNLFGNVLIVQNDDTMHVVKASCCQHNTAQQLAALAAIFRRDTTGKTAAALDAQKSLWTDIVRNAPKELQKFFRAHMSQCSIQ